MALLLRRAEMANIDGALVPTEPSALSGAQSDTGAFPAVMLRLRI